METTNFFNWFYIFQDFTEKFVNFYKSESKIISVRSMYEVMHQREYSVRHELFASEIVYTVCIANLLRRPDRLFWFDAETFIMDKCMDKESFKDPDVETLITLPYENENALKESIGTILSKFERIIGETNNSVVFEVVLAHTEDKYTLKVK